MTKGDMTVYCSFCGQSQHEVLCLIAGPTVFICDACIRDCGEIVAERRIARAVRNELAAIESAQVDTHPKGGDGTAPAPLGSALPEGDAPKGDRP